MREFFSLDGPFNKYGGMIADMIILSFMWVLFSVPIITIGASTTAMFYVSTRRIANREGYITRDFWESFKANLKKSTIIWVFMLLLIWLIWFNINNMEVVGGLAVIIFPAQIILLIEIALMSSYIFPMTARFDMSIKQLLKSSFFMANRHLLTSITCLLLLVAAVLAFFIMPPLALFLGPGMYAWLSSYMIMRIFKRYRPEMDRDPVMEVQELEVQKEEERRKRRIGAARGSDNDEDAISEDDMVTEEIEEINEPNETGDIWEKLRSVNVEELEPTPQPVFETAEHRRQRAIDAFFEDEDAPSKEKVDIWAKLRNSGEDNNEN